MARELHQRAQAYNRASQYAAAAMRKEDGSSNPAASHAAVALNSAARAASQAALLLSQAAQQGQAFVLRTAAVGRGVSSGTGVAVSWDNSSPRMADDHEDSHLSALYGAFIAAHDPVTMKLDAAKFAGLINPGFSGYVDDVGVGVNAYNVNCGLCAQAVAYAFDGRPHTAAGVEHPVSLAEMANWAGTSQSPQSSEAIEDRLRSMPPGSHAIVGVDWEGGDGHWFNAYWDGETVWKVDGQDGSCEPWPPDFPPVARWDSIYTEGGRLEWQT